VGLTLSTLCFGYLAHALGYRAVMVLGGLGAASGAFMLLRLEAPALLGALGYGEETYR
jgi:hypothetical protein